jgi:hypothetical protein
LVPAGGRLMALCWLAAMCAVHPLQTALFNPFTLVSECFGPKICGHLKHLVCCAVFIAIIVFGAPVFNAIIPIVRCVPRRCTCCRNGV